ncbi:integrase [Pseudoalteromonas sp. MIP2626]|uniref:integrase n=1 Tax=Pseudoalteromonas sp. MIP2626 TaxID=2705464 RepID=UPI0031F76995
MWSIRARLEIANNTKELALFNLAIDSKLRGCDLAALKVLDVMRAGEILTRASIVQQKTGTPVMFEIIAHTRQSLLEWITLANLKYDDYLFPSRKHAVPHLGTRAYDRIVHKWVSSIGLESSLYGTHSMRRTKVSILYKRDKTYAPFSFYSIIRKSKAQCVILVSICRMRLSLLKTSTYSLIILTLLFIKNTVNIILS